MSRAAKTVIENLDRAQAFWGLAKDGALVMKKLYSDEAYANLDRKDDEHPVRVYIIVEDE